MPLLCTCLAARLANIYKCLNIYEYSLSLCTLYLVLGFEYSQVCLLFWRFWNQISHFHVWYTLPNLKYNIIHFHTSLRTLVISVEDVDFQVHFFFQCLIIDFCKILGFSALIEFLFSPSLLYSDAILIYLAEFYDFSFR